MSEIPWNETNKTFTWLSSLWNHFKSAMESTPAEALESELNIVPINLRLKELQRMEATKFYQKKDQFITNNMRK